MIIRCILVYTSIANNIKGCYSIATDVTPAAESAVPQLLLTLVDCSDYEEGVAEQRQLQQPCQHCKF